MESFKVRIPNKEALIRFLLGVQEALNKKQLESFSENQLIHYAGLKGCLENVKKDRVYYFDKEFQDIREQKTLINFKENG